MMAPGEYGFVTQLNEGRATKKRPTEFRVDQARPLGSLPCSNSACPIPLPPVSSIGWLCALWWPVPQKVLESETWHLSWFSYAPLPAVLPPPLTLSACAVFRGRGRVPLAYTVPRFLTLITGGSGF